MFGNFRPALIVSKKYNRCGLEVLSPDLPPISRRRRRRRRRRRGLIKGGGGEA